MANRNWRSGGYQSFNQILTPMSYYPQPINYLTDRKSYGGNRGGYQDDYSKRERKDFQSNRKERFSPNKRRSPAQRSQETNINLNKDSKKPIGHYEIKAPRLTFDIKELSSSSLKFRYTKMFIPPDFFHARLNVQDAFPLYRPMKLGNHCNFQVINKEVNFDGELDAVADPADVNYKYSARVMLMTTPAIPELYKLTCHMPLSGIPKAPTKLGVYKNVRFLVGTKGKNEIMAIGGGWSPSLDGDNPEEDPNVLMRTAIRTCKAMTGIDLSNCGKWYKFMDMHFCRPSDRKSTNVIQTEKVEETVAEEDQEIVENVTIFVLDVSACIPSEEEWAKTKVKFDKKLQSLLFPIVEEEVVVKESKVEESVDEEKVEEAMEVNEKVEEVKEEEGEATAVTMDLNQMKVTELRTELIARGLDGKGLKLQLVQRLQEAIDNEKKVAEGKIACEMKVESTEENNITHTTVEATNIAAVSPLPEKEQKRLKWLYRVNEKPSVMVYPRKNANGEHNEFTLITLEKLLEYRIEDQRELSFEVSLFAEQFREMIQRDAAFIIYKSLSDMPEVVASDAVSEEPEAKKARVDIGDRRSKIIVDMALLYAFFVFDTENCGLLRDHDLENILHCIGLNLSRSQVRRLLSRLPSKKGVVCYREVVEREVIEGSDEDLTTLKAGDYSIERLMELSHANKGLFEEVDSGQPVRQGSLALLDKLTKAEMRLDSHRIQLSLLNDELVKIKAMEGSSKDVATHLRDNIAKIADKLTIEQANMAKVGSVSSVYRGLLRSASDHMSQAIGDISGRFEYEKRLADEAREEAERVKALADQAMAANDGGQEEAVLGDHDATATTTSAVAKDEEPMNDQVDGPSVLHP